MPCSAYIPEVLPSEARKSWISYDSNTVQNWITHHPNPNPPTWHLLGRITGRISLQQFFSYWAHEIDPFWKFYLKHQEFTLRIQRNKGHAGHKNVMNILEGNQSWRFTAWFQQLTISRFSASEVGHFCPWNCPTLLLCQPQPQGFKISFRERPKKT